MGGNSKYDDDNADANFEVMSEKFNVLSIYCASLYCRFGYTVAVVMSAIMVTCVLCHKFPLNFWLNGKSVQY